MLILAATVYNFKKWLKFTAPKAIAQASQMINPKLRECFGLIKNMIIQLVLKPMRAKKFFIIHCAL
jgi:hypothetical protein